MIHRIQIKLKEKGLNISRLEKECNLGNGTIKRWESNKPSIDKVEKVANFLGVSIEWLITGKEAPDLSEDEQQLLTKYRSCSTKGKDRIQETAEEMQQLYPITPEGVLTSEAGKTGTAD